MPSSWTLLSPDDPQHHKITNTFCSSWFSKHIVGQRSRSPTVREILCVTVPLEVEARHEAYKTGRDGLCVVQRFHGTTYACSLGDREDERAPCANVTCSICQITFTGFKASLSHYLPKLIYLSAFSSISHIYSTLVPGPLHAMFYCDAVVPIVAREALTVTLTEDEAAIPRYLILYE